MKSVSRTGVLSTVAAIALSAVCLSAGSNPTPSLSERIIPPGITSPSEQRGLNFNNPGVVSKVLVKEGDHVKAGDLLAQQDDRVEVAHLAALEVEAGSIADVQIDAAKAMLAYQQVELQRKQRQFNLRVLGESELEEGKIDVLKAQKQLELATQEKVQKQLEAEEQKQKIAQKKLLSTIDGIVQKINVHEGELTTSDPKTPCIQVVLNEPLYVEVDLPVPLAKNLQLKQKVEVRYDDETNWQTAEVIFFNPVANATANTQRVRLQLDNPDHKQSGLHMVVKMGDKLAATAASR